MIISVTLLISPALWSSVFMVRVALAAMSIAEPATADSLRTSRPISSKDWVMF